MQSCTSPQTGTREQFIHYTLAHPKMRCVCKSMPVLVLQRRECEPHESTLPWTCAATSCMCNCPGCTSISHDSAVPADLRAGLGGAGAGEGTRQDLPPPCGRAGSAWLQIGEEAVWRSLCCCLLAVLPPRPCSN